MFYCLYCEILLKKLNFSLFYSMIRLSDKLCTDTFKTDKLTIREFGTVTGVEDLSIEIKDPKGSV